MRHAFWVALATAMLASPTFAGPPFLSDDPDPTPDGEYEIYLFGAADTGADGAGGAYGVDFNYGANPDLQLTATFPVNFENPDNGDFDSGLGNIELAAKYRFLHQETFGWDVAVFPRVFLSSPSSLGDQHASFLLPIWLGREDGGWSTFGGGGCAINRGDSAQDYCIAGWAVNRAFGSNFHAGAEVFHQTADTKGGEPSTILGGGITYDVSEHLHLLGYAGAQLEHTDVNGDGAFYTSVLFTF